MYGRDASYLLIDPVSHYPGSEYNSWMADHICVEALLSARTVYGDRRDTEYLRQEGLAMLLQARDLYDSVIKVVGSIKQYIARAQTVEVSFCDCYVPLSNNVLAFHRPLSLLTTCLRARNVSSHFACFCIFSTFHMVILFAQ